jgi:hypothetical protein
MNNNTSFIIVFVALFRCFMAASSISSFKLASLNDDEDEDEVEEDDSVKGESEGADELHSFGEEEVVVEAAEEVVMAAEERMSLRSTTIGTTR